MKNYIITLLCVMLLLSGTYIYKLKQLDKRHYYYFPIDKIDTKKEVEKPFYLLLFFSMRNCASCMGAIEVLNRMREPTVVYGIVPDNELKNEMEFRNKTGATFKLLKASRFRKYFPVYTPALMGLNRKGRILLFLPGVPEQKEYLNNFLTTFYYKALELF